MNQKGYRALQLILLIILILSVKNGLGYVMENRKQEAAIEKMLRDVEVIKEEIGTEEPEGKDSEKGEEKKNSGEEFVAKIRKDIPDAVGYFEIPGTKMQHIVVQGKDNDFYLDHDPYKNPSVLGSVFMDVENKGQGSDENTILYGHNVRRGTFFGGLKGYKDEKFRKEHPRFYLTTKEGQETYRIFGVLGVDEYADYRKMIHSEEEFQEWLKTLSEQQVVYFDPPSYGKTVTLSTCESKGTRLVVVGIKE